MTHTARKKLLILPNFKRWLSLLCNVTITWVYISTITASCGKTPQPADPPMPCVHPHNLGESVRSVVVERMFFSDCSREEHASRTQLHSLITFTLSAAGMQGQRFKMQTSVSQPSPIKQSGIQRHTSTAGRHGIILHKPWSTTICQWQRRYTANGPKQSEKWVIPEMPAKCRHHAWTFRDLHLRNVSTHTSNACKFPRPRCRSSSIFLLLQCAIASAFEIYFLSWWGPVRTKRDKQLPQHTNTSTVAKNPGHCTPSSCRHCLSVNMQCGLIDNQLIWACLLEEPLTQWFPNFFGPPPPWFHIHTHSAPLPFLKKHKCACFHFYFIFKNRLNKIITVKLNVLCVNY
jgi:hypothetical protein